MKVKTAGAARTLLPQLCFLFVLALMAGASEWLGEREIVFPEAASIALGALVAPRLAWNTDKVSIFLLIGICACGSVPENAAHSPAPSPSSGLFPPLLPAIQVFISSRVFPPYSFGRPMTTTRHPASMAPAIFSGNPPAFPDSLVTIQVIPRLVRIARFKSWENGPCMAITWLPFHPSFRQASIPSLEGRTRT